MFDLFRSREKAVRYLLGGLLFVVAASMVITLIPGFGSTTGTNSSNLDVVAEIGGNKITGNDVVTQFQRVMANQTQLTPDMLQVYFPQFVEAMLNQRAIVYQAERMGFTVSDEELLAGLQESAPQFFQNGQLDKAQLEAYFAQQGQTVNDALEQVREAILARKFNDATLQGVVVTPQEAEAEFRHKYERAKIQYIAFPTGHFNETLKPTDEDLKKLFEFSHDKYIQPEKFAYQVLVLDQDKMEAAMQLSDEDLRKAYASSMDNFRTPERAHVRHILINTVNKSDSEKKTLLTKAEGILKQLQGGADFAELAKKNSDDPGSKEKGGDLDFVVHGQTVPEFDKMAFNIPVKQISPIVTTQYGYHIIQVLERQPARVQPFEEVKASLASQLKKQQVVDKMQTTGDEMRAAVAKAPGNAEAIAKQFGAELITVPKAGQGDPVPGLGASPEIDQTIAGLQANGVSQVLTLPGNRLVVVVLNSRTPPRPMTFEEAKERVRSEYLLSRGAELAKQKAEEAADRIRKGEDPAAVAKSMKLEAVTSSEFSRNDSVEGVGPAVYFEDAFTKPAGAVIGPSMIQGKYIVAKVIGRVDADMTAFKLERQNLVFSLKQKKAKETNELISDSLMAKLIDEGKVKIHRDAIQRLMASMKR
jgi:peptidyl-prolyl cis-trans isomerase D